MNEELDARKESFETLQDDNEMQKSAESNDESQIEPSFWEGDRINVSFSNLEEDIYDGAVVYDMKNGSRRSFHILAIFFLLWMFVPNVVKEPQQVMSWVMLALTIALGVFIMKYPAYSNRKYARQRQEHSPESSLILTSREIDVTEGPAHFTIQYEDSVAVYDYKNIFAVSYGKGRIITIPKDQLGEETVAKIRTLFHRSLGNRFEKVEEKAKKGLFSNKA